jgi:hypothetical protein
MRVPCEERCDVKRRTSLADRTDLLGGDVLNPQVDEAPATGNEAAKALQEALASGQPTVPLELAAKCVGVRSRSTAYRAARAGKLPFRTLLVGGQGRRVVPTRELAELLGLDPAPSAAPER